MTAPNASPVHLILTRIFVPPVCIRPSVVSEIKAGTYVFLLIYRDCRDFFFNIFFVFN